MKDKDYQALLKDRLLNIVTFCILMQSGSRILGKSPDYILEKFSRYCLFTDKSGNDAWQWGLDGRNHRLLRRWIMKWNVPQLLGLFGKRVDAMNTSYYCEECKKSYSYRECTMRETGGIDGWSVECPKGHLIDED